MIKCVELITRKFTIVYFRRAKLYRKQHTVIYKNSRKGNMHKASEVGAELSTKYAELIVLFIIKSSARMSSHNPDAYATQV